MLIVGAWFLPYTPIDSQASPGMRHCDDGGPAGVADEGARGGAPDFYLVSATGGSFAGSTPASARSWSASSR